MKIAAQEYLRDCLKSLPELETIKKELEQAFRVLVACFNAGGKLLICGNGGSAADADHIVGECMKKFNLRRTLSREDQAKIIESNSDSKGLLLSHLQRSLPAISLSAHGALMTAISNDESAEMIFAQQVFGYGKKGDVLIGLSTSGNSKNVIHALNVAQIFQLKTICITGESGGRMNTLSCDVIIRAPAQETFKVQQYHLAVYHCLCAMVEAEIFG